MLGWNRPLRRSARLCAAVPSFQKHNSVYDPSSIQLGS